MKKLPMILACAIAGSVSVQGNGAVPAIIPAPVKMVDKGGVTSCLAETCVTDKSLPKEGYRLTVSATGVTIASADAAGCLS